MIVLHFEDSSSVIPLLCWCTVDKTKLKVFGPDGAIMIKLTDSFIIVLCGIHPQLHKTSSTTVPIH
jgi:hypothetical protein